MSSFQNPWSSNGSSPDSGTFVNPWTTPGALTSVTPTKDLQNSDVTVPQSPLSTNSTGSGGGFFDNLWNGIKTGYNYGKGILSGAENAAMQNIPKAMDLMMHPSHIFNSDSWDPSNTISNIGQGFTNPNDAIQKYNQTLQAFVPQGQSYTNQLQKGVAMAGGVANDPLSFVPVGKVFQGAKWASDLAGLSPYIAKAADAVVGSKLIQNPLVQGTKDVLGNAFTKNYGASPDLVNALNKGAGDHGANQYNIINSINDLAQSHGLTPDQLNEIGHVTEKSLPGTTDQQALAQKLSDLLSNGAPGSGVGSNLMSHTASAVTGEPLLQHTLPDYFPHIYNNVPDELKGVFPKQTDGVGGLSANGSYNLPRTFGTLQDAMNAGLKPELNPFLATGTRLGQMSKAYTNNNVIQQIKNTPGLLFDKNPIDDVSKLIKTGRMTTDQAAQQLGMSVEDMKKGFVQSQVPQLRGSYIRPADEAALTNFLTSTPKNSIYDKAVGTWKQITLMNSLVHGHNIGYNGMYLGGADPAQLLEHMGNLKSGVADQWVDRATRAGAISQDGGSFAKSLKDASSPSNPLIDNAKYALHGALWDADKGMRTSIFRQAVEGGATDAEAAAKANKFLVNYNNTTPFENSVMKRIFPFYSWMKGNLPLQAEQWINNTPKQLLAEKAINGVSQDLSGNDAKDGKIDTGTVLSDGSHSMVDPYIPGAEPDKVMREGLIPFLYGRSNPILKEIVDQGFNKAYYPSSTLAPNGKEGMAKDSNSIYNPSAPLGYNIAKGAAHAANNLLPLSGVVGSLVSGLIGDTDSRGVVNNALGLPNKDKPAATTTELLTKLFGGFSSRDNPQQDAKQPQYQQKDSAANYIKYLKETGQPVPKSLTKQAYRKVK